ncbi:MAG TPA: type IX secretion system membrane protein PorP/SprF [Bacteroidetes bacterium]|nr:type IX secretion system membrane protein PorP/SprF [Bacteroidota bacterium]
MRRLYTFLFLLFSLAATGQQEAIFSQFFYQKTISNPGAAGSRGEPVLAAFHRQQWLGLEGAPTTQALSFSAPAFANRVGFGLSLINDRIGFFDATYVNAAYAYRMDFGSGILGIGMQGSYRHQRVAWEEVETISFRTDPLRSGEGVFPVFNVGAGVHFQNEKFFVGVAVPYLLEKGFTKKYDGLVSDFSGTTPHLFINAGWVVPFSTHFMVRPAVAVRVVKNAPPLVDLHLSFGFLENTKLWAGATYRWGQSAVASPGDMLSLMCQYQLSQKVTAGAAYDLSINGLKKETSGAYEVMLEYSFLKEEGGVNNPRFFR